MAGIPFTPHSQDMARDKEKSHLDIILEHPYLVLKGTGPDVDPTILSGHVRLFLTEATSIKQITLQFKGKAKLPVQPSDLYDFLISSDSVYDFIILSPLAIVPNQTKQD